MLECKERAQILNNNRSFLTFIAHKPILQQIDKIVKVANNDAI